MGYQLWTSPTTGYRRRGTRLEDFHAALGAKITASDLFEPIRSCPADAAAVEMARKLERLDFDVAGVRFHQDTEVIGFVRREMLVANRVQDYLEPIDAGTLIDIDVDIHFILNSLATRDRLFVQIDGSVIGILTLADLNKPIVRVFFFGLISLLEIHLSYWVAQEYTDETCKQNLGDARIAKAKSNQEKRKERGQNLTLLDCLEFADKRDLFLGDEKLLKTVGLWSKRDGCRKLKLAEDLRNTLAHSQYDLVQGSSWSNLIQLIQWINIFIQRSDALVEERAVSSASFNIGELW